MRRDSTYGKTAGRLALLVLLVAYGGCGQAPEPPERPTVASEQARRGYAAPPAAHLQAEREAKAARKEAGISRPDGPDQFAAYHALIRTPLGRPGARYAAGYRMRALEAAQRAAKQGGWATRPLPWVERGPGNVSGRTRGLVVDVRDPSGDTWYAGAVGGGVWKTTDAGRSWQNLTADWPTLAVVTLSQCAAQPAVLYAGTGEGFFNADAIRGDGIWKTVDGGVTWTQLAATAGNASFRTVNRLVVDPADPERVVAATADGLHLTTDGGATWAHAATTERPAQHVITGAEGFEVLLATVYKTGVLRSTDGGRTWTWVFRWDDHYRSFSIEGRMELAAATSNPLKVYLAVDYLGASDLWVSENRGLTWKRVDERSGEAPDWMTTQGWYNNTLIVHPYRSRTLFVGGINLWRVDVEQNDTARTTTELTHWYPGRPNPDHPDGVFPYVHADHHALAVVPFSEETERFRLISANDGGVEYSDDGGVTWTKTLNGYNTAQFYGVDKRPGADVYIGGMQDNGTWRSPEGVASQSRTPWLAQTGGDGFSALWHAEAPRRLLATSQFNTLFRSVDGGATWALAPNGVGRPSSPFFTTVAGAKSDPDVLVMPTVEGVQRSDDFGASWTTSALTDEDTWGGSRYRTLAAVSLPDPQVVWSGALVAGERRLHVSTDGALTFDPVAPIDSVAAYLSGLATHPTEPETAYALFSAPDVPKLFRTDDLGQTWTNLSGTFEAGTALSPSGLPNVAVYDLLVMPFDTDLIWLGTEIGLFMSEDGGQTWQRSETGLPAVSIWQLAIVDDQVVVATHGRGVWSVTLPELADYTYPAVTRAPRLEGVVQDPHGMLRVALSARSAYDSLHVELDGYPRFRIQPGVGDTVLVTPVAVAEPVQQAAQLVAYRAGRAYRSAVQEVDLRPTRAPQVRVIETFEAGLLTPVDGFEVEKPAGFSSAALHTAHPHDNARSVVYQLPAPIRVAAYDAVLRYRDIALIEPGELGTVFGEAEFWDYVVVEGSLDGLTWRPLAPGYDARTDARWLAAYEAGTQPTEALYRQHQLDLLDTFAPRDIVFLRFRLFADAAVTGWGWAVDDIEVQPNAPVDVEDGPAAAVLTLQPAYPNPFRAATTLTYTVPQPTTVRLDVFDLRGRRIRTLVAGQQPAGAHQTRWDGLDASGMSAASGVYLVRLEAGGYRRTTSIVLTR